MTYEDVVVVVVVTVVVGSEAFSLQDKFLNCRKNSFVL